MRYSEQEVTVVFNDQQQILHIIVTETGSSQG